MTAGKKTSGVRRRRAGYSQAAQTAVQQTAVRVREMHSAIAGKSFAVLRRIPLLSRPAQLAESAHDGIVAGVYNAVHFGSAAFFGLAALLEEHYAQHSSKQPPGRLASRVHSVLNGVFGDHLAASNSRLALDLTIRASGVAVTLDADSLRAAWPAAGQRICVFIHGLACDERAWQPRPPPSDAPSAATAGVDFGRQLQADFGYTPVYIRYNTGLPVTDSGEELALRLEQLRAAWPQPDSRMILVGHSMGGLVALAACEHAAGAGHHWPQATDMLVCLGSPQLGSPVERLGHLITAALHVSPVTLPLGRIAAARSQGIQDLRHGPGAARIPPVLSHIACRFLAASLAEDIENRFGKWFGDGLVTPGSATAHAIDGDVQTAAVGRLGHMELLTDARVYRQISDWLAALGATGPGRRAADRQSRRKTVKIAAPR